MKNHLVSTLSLTLLLSTPLALQAVPKPQPDQDTYHPNGLNPYEQQDAANQEIANLNTTIENLKKQRDAIEPKKKELTLITSTKGTDAALLIATGKQINDLNLLAAQTAALIIEKEAELKTTKSKLPALAARIKTLEPAVNEETMKTFRKYQENLNGIQSWNPNSFGYCQTTKVPSKEDKTKKINQETVKPSDKSDAMKPTKEEYIKIVQERKEQEERSKQGWIAYAASFVYTTKVTTTTKTEETK